MNALRDHIQQTMLVDTHEHMQPEQRYVDEGPDVLVDLFGNYVAADLVSAGATQQAVDTLLDSSNADIEQRWAGVREAWQHCRHTGYGEATRSVAREVYGMDEISVAGIEAASETNRQLRQPGERLRILRERGRLDHIQTDDMQWHCGPDASGPDFFLHDFSLRDFAVGVFDPQALQKATGIEVRDLAGLDSGLEALYARYGPLAIAVKTQHAYDRTLLWRKRSSDEVAPVLARHLRGEELDVAEKLCLGDWCLDRGAALAAQYNLPLKIHTGYYAGNNRMPVEFIRPGNLCALLAEHLDTRFVLMHSGWPYDAELAALAKHYANVWVDMCWAWSIDPHSNVDFLRRLIHSVPLNKVFAFGGDTAWPNMAVAYAQQARRGLERALQAEVDEGTFDESEAMALATKLMNGNQYACFDLAGRRAALEAEEQGRGLSPVSQD